MRLIRKYIELSFLEKKLFLEAIFFMFFFKLFLLLPLKVCLKRFKSSKEYQKKANSEILINVRKAIMRANKITFWKNKCLVQSLTGRFMLQRRNIESKMYLGLQFDNEKKLVAHAWLISGEIQITSKGKNDYKEIFCI